MGHISIQLSLCVRALVVPYRASFKCLNNDVRIGLKPKGSEPVRVLEKIVVNLSGNRPAAISETKDIFVA
jgi:hypothetical protein